MPKLIAALLALPLLAACVASNDPVPMNDGDVQGPAGELATPTDGIATDDNGV